jgi:hypothetical protein
LPGPDYGWGVEPRGATNVVLPAFALQTLLLQRLPVGDQRNGETLIGKGCSPLQAFANRQPSIQSLGWAPQATRGTRAAAGFPVRARMPAWPSGAVLLCAFACGAVLTSQ